jgi:hypothetical protein
MTRFRFRVFPAIVLLIAAGGCNRSGLVNATGRLTYKGQPVPSTYVIFYPEEEGRRPSQGLTDDEGHFKLLSSTTATGVLVGKHAVILKYYVSADEELGKTPPKVSKELKAVILKYGDPTKTPLHQEIKKDGEHFDIAIE